MPQKFNLLALFYKAKFLGVHACPLTLLNPIHTIYPCPKVHCSNTQHPKYFHLLPPTQNELVVV